MEWMGEAGLYSWDCRDVQPEKTDSLNAVATPQTLNALLRLIVLAGRRREEVQAIASSHCLPSFSTSSQTPTPLVSFRREVLFGHLAISGAGPIVVSFACFAEAGHHIAGKRGKRAASDVKSELKRSDTREGAGRAAGSGCSVTHQRKLRGGDDEEEKGRKKRTRNCTLTLHH